jgi:hypothetical protein
VPVPLLAPQLVAALLCVSPDADPAGLVAAAAEDAATTPSTGQPPAEPAAAPAGTEPATAAADSDGLHPGWFYGATALAVVFGIAGGTTGGLALGERDEYDSALRACLAGDAYACGLGPGIVDDYELYATLTNVFLPCAGAFAIVAVVLAFLTDFGGDDAPPDDGGTYFTFFGTSAGDGPGAALVLRF